jgi:dolichol-phosphate mannosyltransferase
MTTPRGRVHDALVCIPTYNERSNLPSLLDELLRTADVDVLIIDDNSPDGSGRIADLRSQDDPRISVIHRAAKLGLGTAYVAGFKWGLARGYKYLLEMDADFSHQPRYVPQLLRAVERDADVALGSRYVDGGGVENWPLHRLALSKGGSLYARSILSMDVQDLTSGFKCFRREVLEALDLDACKTTGYAFQIELSYRAHRLGFRIKEIPIMFFERENGKSKMSNAIIAEAVTAVWKLRLGSDDKRK